MTYRVRYNPRFTAPQLTRAFASAVAKHSQRIIIPALRRRSPRRTDRLANEWTVNHSGNYVTITGAFYWYMDRRRARALQTTVNRLIPRVLRASIRDVERFLGPVG